MNIARIKKAPAATGAGQLAKECKLDSNNNTCNLKKEGHCNVIRAGEFSIPNNHHIFPLQAGMKIPQSGSAGFHDAVPAEDAAYKWPNIFNGNVGLYPGPSGILVIDVDTKPHKDGSPGVGIETIKNLQRLHGKLPITFTVKTPSGGVHLYYQKPKISRVGNNKIGDDVDIRCDGGYVLEPGSIVGGKTYIIRKDIPLAALPDSWVELFKPGSKQCNLSSDIPQVSREKVVAALEYIPADINYDIWISVLAALQSECYEDLAHSWSAQSPQYSASEVAKKLSSFTASGGVGIGSIIHIAKKYGYLPTTRRKKPNLKHTAGTLEWKDPEIIPNALLPVLPFNTSLLPKVFQIFSEDVADRMQCPVEYVAVIIMASLGGVVGKQCSISPKQNDNWCIVPNLWAALIGRPSAMKSPAMTAAQSGVAALISEARKEYTHELTQFEKAKMIYDAEKDSIKIHIRNAIKNNQDPSSIAMPEKPDKPVEKRYMTNAGSVERLIKLLEQNPEGIIQSRDELTGWLRSMDNSNSQDARAFYIESWNGAGSSFSYDTVTHGHLFCETGPCVSVMGTIQPGCRASITLSGRRQLGWPVFGSA